MSHPIHRVTGVSIVGPFALSVAFSDGTEQRIDFKQVLHGLLFGPLQDQAAFDVVTLDAPRPARSREPEAGRSGCDQLDTFQTATTSMASRTDYSQV